ncbi:histidine biosynthesis trifunctional-protein [Clavulina sp. PMI_390]|nr:histidine biosynthesis trifunctional-protein [Clavulina sp. PMI_390]
MFSFLPLLDGGDSELINALSRLGPILESPQSLNQAPGAFWVFVKSNEPVAIDTIASWLDQGAEKVVLPQSLVKECGSTFPKERLMLLFDVSAPTALAETISSRVSGVVIQAPLYDAGYFSAIKTSTGLPLYYLPPSTSLPTTSLIKELSKASITPIIPTSILSIAPSSSSSLNIADAFLAPVTSDRPDGLFPTIVSDAAHGGKSLGLVYSSRESIAESIITGKGVYQSRKHGLWRKGETSGSTQDVLSIRADCDADCLEFGVVQHGSGFCHLGTASCFGGNPTGLVKLEATLLSRKESAVEGSYTSRLFNDSQLLAAKIREEAEELIQAKTKDEVAFEAADLLYFALTQCIAKGVSLADVEAALDEKSMKVSRRTGNAKPQFVNPVASSSKPAPPPPKAVSPPQDPDAPIQMRSADLDTVDKAARAELLKRPVLRSDEMIAKVKPIVDSIRVKGDAGLLELTAKFDKATLTSPIIRAPFPPESMVIPEDVRSAIDVAYDNIFKFHAAQAEKAPLVIETMPGVVCTRFARPIARVGLYVPGGTAILPSTALMLGIPAQVAGCKEIVLATPPRPDGSISPEVMYVAQRVGATAVLKAGGAQAVAALAYGTESCPKVDKIFGPGNQWVTAAKMLVQNDTDALVSIDMPAGPSEVLVMTDSTGNPTFIAADLLSQAEHGVDSQVVLVAVGITEDHLASITAEIDRQAKALPRVDIVRESIPKSIIVRTKTLSEAVAFSNDYAPEHLILHLENAPTVVKDIDNAGSIFVGAFTPESCGDYASGTNHTLPTNGYARQFSGVNTLSFQKHITSQEITQAGLSVLGPNVVTMAECEGLSAHANAVRVRLQQ